MKRNISFLFLYANLSLPLAAQQHMHGQGQAFVTQQDNQWMIELVMPAHDLVGFEHTPQTAQQKAMLERLKVEASMATHFVSLSGQCKLVSSDLNMPHEDSDRHEKHNQYEEHHEHGGHNKQEQHREHKFALDQDEDAHHRVHGNIEIHIEYQCNSPVSQVSFPLLKTYKSLESLNVEWFTQNGQGATKISASTIDIIF